MGRHGDPLGPRMKLTDDGLRVSGPTGEYGAAAWLAKRASLHAGREALVQEERRLTYGELDARVTRLANALRGLGLGRMDRVSTLVSNCIEFVELFFATARI